MRELKRHFIYLLLVIVAVCGLWSCSTKRNTIITRTYHDITSRYNGYYYANLNVQEGVQKMEEEHKDDFSKILPIFIYADAKHSQSIYPEMDKAIKKASLVIQRHTITDRRGREIPGAVKWIEYCYMLIGRAHFYKHDYYSALESFDYVSKEYKKFPIKYQGLLWEVRTYNELGSLYKSAPIIDLLQNDKKFPKKLAGELAAVTADYYIKNEEYDAAIKPLIKAITMTRKKKVRARYTFILAQLYQKQGNEKKAGFYYAQSIKLHPGYDMAFNAQINRAVFYQAGSKDSKGVVKMLKKMLKDNKNVDNLDQIYYALAEISEKEHDMPSTINYLKLSVSSSTVNTNQKALSYLKLAKISFKQTDYPTAQKYYDSTATFLSKDYPDYKQIIDIKNNLNKLVTNLNVISYQDSMLRLSRMSKQQQDSVADAIIAEVKKKEEEAAELKQQQAEDNLLYNQQQQQQQVTTDNGTAGNWYFYNQTALSFGVSDFEKKWGDRKLEDNWRRSTKQSDNVDNVSSDGSGADSTLAANGGTKPKKGDLKSRAYYLKNIPKTDKEVKAANDKIIEAYYNIGSLYKEHFNNDKKAAADFEELLRRYKDNKYKLSTYYQLFRLYKEMGNDERATYYKNKIVQEAPNSVYAKIIKNPDYIKETKASKSEVQAFYEKTWQSYEDGNYQQTLSDCKKADSSYAKSDMMPMFAYVEAMAIGKTQGKSAYLDALAKIVVKYSHSPVAKKAQETIDLIKYPNGMPVSKDSTKTVQYKLDKKATFFWVLAVQNEKGNLNNFKIQLSNMNHQSFGTSNLQIKAIFLNKDTQLVIVRKFPGLSKAKDYFNFISQDKMVFKALQPGTYSYFFISSGNYDLFYKDKGVSRYLEFFHKSYFKK